MAVPSHDEKNFAFAKKYNLPLKDSNNPIDKETKKEVVLEADKMTEAFTEMGIMTNQENSMDFFQKALTDIALYVEKMDMVQDTINID